MKLGNRLKRLSDLLKGIAAVMVGGSDPLGKREEGEPVWPILSIFANFFNFAGLEQGKQESKARISKVRARESKARESGARVSKSRASGAIKVRTSEVRTSEARANKARASKVSEERGS